MSDAQLRDEVKTLFIAGYETTSVALTWAFKYLIHQPELMQKLRDEVDAVLGEREPAFEDLMKLNYTRMVLQEAMRIRPPSYWVPRVAMAPDQIDGYDIPAGAEVVSLTFMYHHHPDFWPDSERFDPERFLPERSADRHPYAWLPFGAGQRQCIGKDFALMEGALALAMVVQRFNLQPVSETVSPIRLAGTLRPKHAVQAYLESKP